VRDAASADCTRGASNDIAAVLGASSHSPAIATANQCLLMLDLAEVPITPHQGDGVNRDDRNWQAA
jgi:hypothetical protein